MSNIVDFNDVSTAGLESSPVVEALVYERMKPVIL